ncbi:MAG: M3 family metallopeptidase [candidate division KSB1 bacterium]|nr:M3 family metallopeptidase [candidate division KSB1 bacterium]MDZ7357075.1 M3 family metallopeptidase [candidate division KSB1 bacterium]
MKHIILLFLSTAMIIFSCVRTDKNPFFVEWKTPFQTPPFEKIKEHHYMPAFEEGIKLHRQDITKIAENAEPPTFDNTVVALDNSGELLTRVSNVFFNMTSAHTNDSLQSIAKRVAPMLAKHQDDILLNEKLFQRIKKIYQQRDQLGLNPEQNRLLEKYYKEFVRGGADLADSAKAELRKINEELSVLSLQFGDNVLKEVNNFEMVIENEADLIGLPENVRVAAAEAAKERGKEGKWVFTLHKPSLIPFLQYSERRDLREKMFKAYIMQCDNNNEWDNKKILSRIAALRVRRAKLLGYPTHADFVLEENMAKTPQAVYELLNQLWKPALKVAKKEANELQSLIFKEGNNFKLEPWDWWFYAEKLRKAKYDLDEEMLRPYFKLENVINGVFMVANKLYGITFNERHDIPKYHPDVKTFEVKEADGSHIAVLYTDYFPRSSKRGGAWMNEYRQQYKRDGRMITPIICNVGNFSKPTSDKPSLLSLEEVLTLFHEFGHALHGLLSNCTYQKLAGTNVARDFVELPSQIMENWATEPEVLKMYARHYQTGEPMPDELIEKIKNSSKFNQGFATVEYLAAAFLDMDWHTLTETTEQDPVAFENQSMNKIGMIPEIVVRYRSPYFRHIFAGGYSAGYYSYIWAEVLDADAFQAFKETSLFDQKTAKAFRDHILSKGDTEDPMLLYKRFRGAEPKIDALLEKRGLK